jgi:PAS domain S-box-containing protein
MTKNIFLKTLMIAIIFGMIFWIAESIYQFFYFKENFQFMVFHEPLKFDESLFNINKMSRSSLFYRISFMISSLLAGIIVGLLLKRNQERDSALRESEKNYREAISAVNDGIFSFSIPDNFATVSPPCFTMLGYEPDEFPVSYEIFSNLLHPDDRKQTETIIKRYVVAGEPFSVEFRMKTRNGHWLWVQSRGHVIEWDSQKHPVRVTGILANIDSRVKTQKRLREYTERLEEAENIAKIGHWEFDYQAEIWNWSNAIFNIIQMKNDLGITPTRRAPLKYIHPEDRETVESEFTASLKSHKPFNCIHRLLLNNGEIKYVNERGHHIFDSNGSPIRSFGTIQDITETRKTEQALYDSEKRYRALFEGAGEGILVVDKETSRIKHANKAMCRLLGYNLDGINKLILRDIHPEQAFNINSAWFNVKNGETLFSSDVLCKRNDGTSFPVEINSSAIEIDGHEAVVGCFTDLTESYKLDQERRMLKFAVDNAAIEVFICNPDGSCHYANSAACEKLGYSRDEIEHLNIWDFDKKFSSKSFTEIWQRLKVERTLRAESEQVDKNGKTFQVEYTTDFLVLGDKEYACLYIQDITERKEFESALVKAKEDAERSDRLKSLFLANMSHEIRTPMNGILGFADLLQRKDISETKRQEYAKIINECGNNLLQLINDILDISKIEAGEIKVVKNQFCLNIMMEDIYTLFEPMLENADGKICFEMRKSLRDDECIIRSDENRLRQIITNLLSNAIKFTKHGNISFGYIAKEKTIEFYVKDTGIGIPPDKLSTIFEPFRQAEESLSRKYRGTGLGLAIAKNYVKLLGGEMSVESKVNFGSTFYFSIPFEKPEEKFRPKQKSSLEKTSVLKWINKKILIVEDDRINFMLLEKLIEKTGAAIFHAATGRDAVEMGTSIPDLDLILMDVRLPDFTGWEATRKIKRFNPDIPIVAQTANAMPEDREKSFDAGCDAYLPKPISKELFYGTLDKFLNS